ncbi:glutamate-cysteine ligase family protein [Senegalia massiliensis]|uniref:Glutamate--cysteine ligase n=1 Tax=Senegalia massiliensis TaxID=1720316 RepID=A0A845QUL9_9CLOT|nr:glutamate-cysteine ligase family protein [Senegalia massiliensis]NBI05941.1 glutamate--cysteine ligase [Senegalia massiliensis]
MDSFFIDKQIKYFEEYFNNNHTKEEELKIGAEFEHFIIDKETLKSIPYFGQKGVEDTLIKLKEKGWNEVYTDNYLMGLYKKNINITLEPGAQFEVSINPFKDIKKIEDIYMNFLNDIVPILETKNQYIVCMGYQPNTKIEDIQFIPKERYKYMSEYFKDKGKYAHNMMKGTAALQVAIDYRDEVDFKRKFRLSNLLSPILSLMFDNSPIFEEEIYPNNILRTDIWNKCDNDRSKIVTGALDKDFGYSDYAKYILNNPPIIIKKEGEFIFTKEKKTKDIFDVCNISKDEFEHILTMFFPDVRVKGFIEVRMMDSVPFPLNLAGVALVKGIMYSDSNIDELLDVFKDFDDKKISIMKKRIMEYGYNADVEDFNLNNIVNKIYNLAYNSLNEYEKRYLMPLKKLISEKKTPAMNIKENMNYGLYQAIKENILNDIVLEAKNE